MSTRSALAARNPRRPRVLTGTKGALTRPCKNEENPLQNPELNARLTATRSRPAARPARASGPPPTRVIENGKSDRGGGAGRAPCAGLRPGHLFRGFPLLYLLILISSLDFDFLHLLPLLPSLPLSFRPVHNPVNIPQAKDSPRREAQKHQVIEYHDRSCSPETHTQTQTNASALGNVTFAAPQPKTRPHARHRKGRSLLYG